MKIVKLVAENVKRLHAVEITPDGSLITIGGRNGAGKSSVLDSIAYALGGEKLVPSEPIRSGEAEAKIVVDLGDLVVTRRFRRERIDAPKPEGVEDRSEDHRWGLTTSTLAVTNKDGARYPSPQAVLDKLLGKLTFDPLAFARDDEKRQAETLRKLVGLDTTPVDARRKAAADERAMLKKTHAIKAAQLASMAWHPDAGSVEQSMDAVADEMRRAEELRLVAQEAGRAHERSATEVTVLAAGLSAQAQRVEEMKKTLAALQTEYDKGCEKLTRLTHVRDAQAEAAKDAKDAVPDTAALRARIGEIEAANAKARANQKYLAAQGELAKIESDIEMQHNAVIAAEMDKKTLLFKTEFPVAGLGLTDDGVTFNGLPLAQAGSAEQVRVSVAIGAALNPKLRVLLVRNGNLLDSESLKAVAAQAEAAGMQVWMEYVSESKDGVAVMLVDGEVV